ncbi:MAG: cellulase family glycosylhydrolase [Firmicutes bacterium]|nr:cellulase family glycosylhydrolase [Bacillota bacterium]
MKKNNRRVIFFAVLALLAVTLMSVSSGNLFAANGFYISGGKLMDANGNQFIIRGISHPHCWYTSRTAQALIDIKSVKANAVRVVCSNGREGWTVTTAADLTNIINQCKTNKLICIPELHDTTGYGEAGAACSLAAACNYWNSVKSALVGQEKYVIINIGNEPYGNTNAGNWVADTKAAIQTMRNNGFTHTLMVDAGNWGQDWQFYMRDNAQAIFDADPQKNTILSVHMYGVFDTASEITSYISAFTSKGLPLVVGEFGHNHSDGNPDEDTIMSACQSNGIGWMAWSWSGNGGGVEYLDMVNQFNVSSPTSWGTRVFTGANGLSTTSKECSVFSGTQATPTPTRRVANTPTPTRRVTPTPTRRGVTPTPTRIVANTPSPTQGSGGGYVVSYVIQNDWGTGATINVIITNNSTAAVNGWTLAFTFPGNQVITNLWNGTYTQSGASVTVKDAGYNANIPANGGSTSFGFNINYSGTNAKPASFTLNGAPCAVQ